MQLTAGWILLLSCQMTESARCSAFGVQRSVFRVQGLTFSVRGAGPSGAVRTSVTLMGQDIGNTVTF
jgi:hypothetical protein